jgi:hypothetical protein
VCNEKNTPFWDSPWLHGTKPKDIAPLIYTISSLEKMECQVGTSWKRLGSQNQIDRTLLPCLIGEICEPLDPDQKLPTSREHSGGNHLNLIY